MVGKEIIVYGVDLNKTPSKEDALAIIPVPLTIIPLKEVVLVPPKKTYGQS
jgi:hypothetical protein